MFAEIFESILTDDHMHYILPGKFSSDPLEARFGMYRQLSGANFYISCKQLMESEKKLRALNFIRARIPIEFQDLPPDESASHNEFVDIDLNFSDIYSFDEIDNLDELDSSTVYFVAGYVSHSLIRRHKCECCKSHLSADSSFEDLGQDETRLFVEINRGGLSSPSDFCFTVCLLSYLYFKQLKSSEISMKRFLCYENQQNVFVENVIRRLSTFLVHK